MVSDRYVEPLQSYQIALFSFNNASMNCNREIIVEHIYMCTLNSLDELTPQNMHISCKTIPLVE